MQGLAFGRGRLPLARAALALALCGAGQQAKSLADELSKRFPEDTLSQEIWLPVIRAALSLQRGAAAQTLEQLHNTLRYEAAAEFWPQYLRGQAYLQLKQGAEAVVEFQKILDHRWVCAACSTLSAGAAWFGAGGGAHRRCGAKS